MRKLLGLAFALSLTCAAPLVASAENLYTMPMNTIPGSYYNHPYSHFSGTVVVGPAGYDGTRVITSPAVIPGGISIQSRPTRVLVPGQRPWMHHESDVSPFGLLHPNNWFGRIFGYME